MYIFTHASLQSRSQGLSSMRRCGGKTLVGAGHVTVKKHLALGSVGKVLKLHAFTTIHFMLSVWRGLKYSVYSAV